MGDGGSDGSVDVMYCIDIIADAVQKGNIVSKDRNEIILRMLQIQEIIRKIKLPLLGKSLCCVCL